MKTRVLIIDDNVELSSNIAELLESVADTVVTCTGGESALKEANDHGFHVALVDVRLRDGSSGLELIPKLRKFSHFAEFIMITGNATLDTALVAVRHGVFAYLLKPFDTSALTALVERALTQVTLRNERKALALELGRSELQVRALVETIEALIVELGEDGRAKFCNRFTSDLAGLDRATANRMPFVATCFLESDHAEVLEAISGARHGFTTRNLELPFVTSHGKSRTVRWTIAPLVRDGAGANRTVLAAGIDVTEQLVLRRRAGANEAMATMGQLTTGLAHEIRNPLNAAQLQLEVLHRRAQRIEDSDLRDVIQHKATLVKGEIQRLSLLLNDFLSYARPQGIDQAEVNVARLFADVAELQTPGATKHGISLCMKSPEDLVVGGDFGKLKQVLINLVGNAIDAMRDQKCGTICLEAEADGEDAVVLRVTDDGPGLSEEATSLFEPFVTTKDAGTGLGLSIVKKIVEQHGGTVSLVPVATGGTSAELRLHRKIQRASTTPPMS